MADPFVDEYRTHLFLYKQWKRKIDPEQAVKNTNTKLTNNCVSLSKVKHFYNRFENGEIDLFDKDTSMFISSAQSGKPQLFIDSIVRMSDDASFTLQTFHMKDGRYLISFDEDSKPNTVIVYDLLLGTKRSSPVSFELEYISFKLIGDFLVGAQSSTDEMFDFFSLKINYDDLSVKELPTTEVYGEFEWFEFYVDQMDSQKFIITDDFYYIIGEIQDGEIELEDAQKFRESRKQGKRLLGDQLQYFTDLYTPHADRTKFCQMDLNSADETQISVSFYLDDEDEEEEKIVVNGTTDNSCWSHDKFYIFGETQRFEHKLLMFDLPTFKWTDLKIQTNSPMIMHIDENEFLTCCIRNEQDYGTFYRVGLRKPDTLMNLTLLTALREENLYGNKKYMNAARNSTLQLKFTS